MAERTLVVDHLKLMYDGVFNPDELYNIIAQFFFEKGWDWHERMNEYQNDPEAKNIRMVFEPWKNISDYYKIAVKITVIIYDAKKMEIGKNLNVSKGEIKITFDGFVIGDRNDEWKDKPLNWFISLVLEKYFFRGHFRKAETWIKSDIEDLHQKIKTYLNTFRYSYSS